MTRSRRRWLVIAAIATVFGLGLTWITSQPVRVTTVRMERTVPIQVYGLGTVEARIVSRLGFDVTGTIVDLTVDHGDLVRHGDVLARLHAGEQIARVNKAEAGLKKAEAAQVQAIAKVARAATLLEQKRSANRRRQTLLERRVVSAEAGEEVQANQDIARADLDVAKSDVEAANGGLADARAELLLQRELLAKFTLLAPFDGLVMSRAKELGSVMAPGNTAYTLVAPDTVWVMAFVDEALAGDIEVGQRAEIRLRSRPRDRFSAKVTRIDIENERVSEERRVYLAFDQRPASFALGEQAEVLIDTATLPEAMLVPRAAVQGFNGRTGTVWTLENQRLTPRQMSFGHRTLDGRLEIIGPLPTGIEVLAAVPAKPVAGRFAIPEAAP